MSPPPSGSETPTTSASASPEGRIAVRPRRRKLRTPLGAYGEPMLFLTGGALAISLVMVVGLILFVVRMGLATFWPLPVEQVTTLDGRTLMGEVTRIDSYEPSDDLLATKEGELRARIEVELADEDGALRRRLFRTGNFDLTDTHFTWVLDAQTIEGSSSFPEWVLVLERREWGRFYGTPVRFLEDGEIAATEPGAIWERYREHHADVIDRLGDRTALEKHDLGRIRFADEQARRRMRAVQLELGLSTSWTTAYRRVVVAERELATAEGGMQEAAASRLADARERLERLESAAGRPDPPSVERYGDAVNRYLETARMGREAQNAIVARINELDRENARHAIDFVTADGTEKRIALSEIVRAYPPNRLGLGDKIGLYLARWWEFLSAEPRYANSEGGVFPAIVGTVLMTMIMAVLVVPFGVMAALYLREYARGGFVTSTVRIAINNLAGVPSIVFGVFGLGFFCYGVGGFIDGGPSSPLPSGRWFLLLGLLVVVATVGFVLTMMGIVKPGQRPGGFKRIARTASGVLWLLAALGAFGLIATTPFFDGFFRENLPNPTFGKTALVWASFTLALLTLPVVIVATEEALAAVPNSMREGSYACGASKWQTIKRIVLPRAMPGIMTGMILAMARGAGEVAPLMVVGAVKFAPELPVSASPAEYFGLNRSFMHLGFHIYDMGFKSQNSEASKPLVFTTTLLLITIVTTLNLAAIWLRSRLRRRFVGVQF